METTADTDPAVSVIVPVRNGLPWISDQLQALADQECPVPWEVVVADNGSSDGTLAEVSDWVRDHARFRVVDASARIGPGAARNIGVALSRGRLLAFCDADDVVQPGWLAACVEALENADATRGTYDFTLLGSGRRSPPSVAATGQLAFLPAGLGANLGVRREAFDAIGGFAEDVLVGEDIDLSWRLQIKGYGLTVAANAVVAKRERSTPGAVLRTNWSYGRSGPVLYRRFQALGMGRDIRGASKEWTWLILALPTLSYRQGRIRWARTFGMRTGRLFESLVQWTFFP